ncbi:MAG: acyl-CoA thioesterase [Actinobacteria bacterium]|nr:acyl-CoA thioesterase [Actinomycetota bacterium]
MLSTRVLAQMRWSDMDALGHVHNAAFLNYFELARAQLVFSALRLPGDYGIGLVVRRHEIDYVRQLIYRPTPVAVETSVAAVGRTSLTLTGWVGEPDEDIRYAAITTVLVAVDPSDGAAVGIPDPIREALLADSGEN